jgi:hypothetical protein
MIINLSFQAGFLFNENVVDLHLDPSMDSTRSKDKTAEIGFLRSVAAAAFVTTGHRANLHSANTVDL